MASVEMKVQRTLLKARNWELAKLPGLTRAIEFSNGPVAGKSAQIAVPEVVLDWYGGCTTKLAAVASQYHGNKYVGMAHTDLHMYM